MIDHAHDLATVFYGPEFATRFLRQRPEALDLEVMVILGTQDDEALDGRARATVRAARFVAGQDVRADDRLTALEAAGIAVPAGSVFRVLEHPMRVNDGNELETLLSSVAG